MSKDTAIPAAAPAAPAAPDANSAVPAAVAANPDATPADLTAAAQPPAAQPAPAAAPPAAPPAASLADVVPPATPTEDAKWYLSNEVPGVGDAPEWFKADKYKTMEDQAKAYTELESRFGAFTGAPEDGVYKINMPEGIAMEFQTDHSLFQELNQWAVKSQLSQKAYDDVIGMFARYEASVQPDLNEIKGQLGDSADARISSLNQWAKSNLSEAEYESYRAAQSQSNAAEVFKAMEAIVSKTRQVAMPKPGDDVTGAVPTTLEEINQLQAKTNDKGQRLYEIDSEFRAMVEQKRFAYFKAQERPAT